MSAQNGLFLNARQEFGILLTALAVMFCRRPVTDFPKMRRDVVGGGAVPQINAIGFLHAGGCKHPGCN